MKRLLAALGALALALTGCGGDGEEGGAGGASGRAPTAAELEAAREARKNLPDLTSTGRCVRDDERDGDGSAHRDGVTYEVNPPAGGDHSPRAAVPGTYRKGQVPDGELVHAMEHGDVVVWHTNVISLADEERLHALVERFPKKVLVVERTGMDTPIAATAWHARLICQDMNLEAIAAFIDERKDKGPERFEE